MPRTRDDRRAGRRGCAFGRVGICFDLLNGGDKGWGRYPPYRELAYEAAGDASEMFTLGSTGGGLGATTIGLKGGLGSASAGTRAGFTVGALAVVNALGSAVVGDGPHFWAGPWEVGSEFGGRGPKPAITPDDLHLSWKGGETGTTIALVATDAALSPAQARRLAVMASAGLARALRLTFAPLDGDTIFAAGTGRNRLTIGPNELTEIGAAAADCLTRAIARGVYEAEALPFAGALPSWRNLFEISGG
jgi:L-aminopeptidase/D-esterase-like protein